LEMCHLSLYFPAGQVVFPWRPSSFLPRLFSFLSLFFSSKSETPPALLFLPVVGRRRPDPEASFLFLAFFFYLHLFPNLRPFFYFLGDPFFPVNNISPLPPLPFPHYGSSIHFSSLLPSSCGLSPPFPPPFEPNIRKPGWSFFSLPQYFSPRKTIRPFPPPPVTRVSNPSFLLSPFKTSRLKLFLRLQPVTPFLSSFGLFFLFYFSPSLPHPRIFSLSTHIACYFQFFSVLFPGLCSPPLLRGSVKLPPFLPPFPHPLPPPSAPSHPTSQCPTVRGNHNEAPREGTCLLEGNANSFVPTGAVQSGSFLSPH